jgi:hypothetical protein
MTPVPTGSEDFLLRGNVVELAVVLPMKALVERRARGEEPGPPNRRRSSCWSRSAGCCAPGRSAPSRGSP